MMYGDFSLSMKAPMLSRSELRASERVSVGISACQRHTALIVTSGFRDAELMSGACHCAYPGMP